MSFHGRNVPIKRAIKLTFYLPDEGMRLAEWKMLQGNVLTTTSRLEAHTGGVVIHFTDRLVQPDANGRVQVEYSVTLGGKIAIGPQYGFIDPRGVSIPLAYFMPEIGGVEKSLDYAVVLAASSGHELLRMSGRTIDGHYSGLAVGGDIVTETLRHGNQTINLRAFHEIGPDLRSLGQSLLERTFSTFAPGGQEVTLIDLPASGAATYNVLKEGATVATDITPATPERTSRATSAVVELLLRNNPDARHLTIPDERWLFDALPRFWGLRQLIDYGAIEEQHVRFDLQTSRLIAREGSLARLSELQRSERDLLLRSKGLLALFVLSDLLRNSGKTLEQLIKQFETQTIPLSFKNTLRLAIGIRKANQFWNAYIESSRWPSTPLDFSLSEAGLEATDKAGVAMSRLLVTGNTNGTIELCGCKLAQEGGYARLATELFRERLDGIPLVDLGGLFPAARHEQLDDVARMEVELQLRLLRRLKYSAIAVGPGELPVMSSSASLSDLPLASANILGHEQPILVKTGEATLAFIGWMDAPALEEYANVVWLAAGNLHANFSAELALFPALDRISKTLPVVLFGNIHPITIKKVAARYRGRVVLILSSYQFRPDVNSGELRRYGFVGNTYVVFLPGLSNALYSLMLQVRGRGTYISGATTTRFALSDQVPSDLETSRLIDQFYSSDKFRLVASEGVPRQRFLESFSTRQGFNYVGSRSCSTCHPKQYLAWHDSPHQSSFVTLLGAHRAHHPDCVACHVTGYGTLSGYSLRAPNKDLQAVGCEMCHGPAEFHVRQPSRENIQRTPNPVICRSCHDSAHSAFENNPQSYYERAKHRLAN